MALLFDGTNDVVDYGDITVLDTPTAFTLSMWASFDEAGAAANDGIIGKSSTGATNGFAHVANNGGFGFRFFIGATAYNKATMFATTAFQNLTVVFDGAGAADADRLKVYLDGVLQTAASFTGTIPASVPDSGAGSFKVGRATDDLGFGAGTFGNIKVWTAALSAGEVLQEVYQYTPVRESNLLIWTPYTNGVGTDYSGNAFHGSITEATVAADPLQVNYGNAVVSSSRARRSTRRSNLDSFRRLGPHVPMFWRGV